jgi:hypothetical protein
MLTELIIFSAQDDTTNNKTQNYTTQHTNAVSCHVMSYHEYITVLPIPLPIPIPIPRIPYNIILYYIIIIL